MAELLESVIVIPVLGAALSVTVQETLPAPATLAGLHATPVSCGSGDKLIEAVFCVLLTEAVSTAVWLELTALAWDVKVAVAEPAATVTLAGTVTLDVLLERATARLAAGAALNVTVQERLPEPVIIAGLQDRADTCGSGDRAMEAVCWVLFTEAVRTAV